MRRRIILDHAKHAARLAVLPAALLVLPAERAAAENDAAAPFAAAARDAGQRRLGPGIRMYVPQDLYPGTDGAYNVIYHFNIGNYPERAVRNIDRSNLNAAIVSVTLQPNGRTETYHRAYRKPDVFANLMARTEEALREEKGDTAKLGRIALSSWSAGSAAIKEILKQPGMSDRVDAVFMADGLYSEPGGKGARVNRASLRSIANFALRAKNGEKVFALTHSSLPNGSHATTKETAAALRDMTDVAMTVLHAKGPNGLRQLYTADEGSLHIAGYKGPMRNAHAAHVDSMGTLLYTRLATAWGQRPAALVPYALPAP